MEVGESHVGLADQKNVRQNIDYTFQPLFDGPSFGPQHRSSEDRPLGGLDKKMGG